MEPRSSLREGWICRIFFRSFLSGLNAKVPVSLKFSQGFELTGSDISSRSQGLVADHMRLG